MVALAGRRSGAGGGECAACSARHGAILPAEGDRGAGAAFENIRGGDLSDRTLFVRAAKRGEAFPVSGGQRATGASGAYRTAT